MSTQLSQTFINLRHVYSETKRLVIMINKSSIYFDVCCLFLIPIFIFDIYIFNTNTPVFYTIIFLLAFLAFIGMIIHTSFHSFNGRPPTTLDDDIKSLSSYLLPLLSTLFVSSSALILPFGISGFFICKLLETNDVNVIYASKYFYWIIAMLAMMAVCVIYLQVIWVLALVVSVVEWRWGYGALRRSAYLIKGMKMTGFSLIVFFGIILGGSCYCVFLRWPSYGFRSLIVYYVVIATASLMIRNGVTASVVVYIDCMKMHGELAMEETGDEEIASPDYIRLPTNDNDDGFVAWGINKILCLIRGFFSGRVR